jgi:cytochrome c heme-lyase
VCDSSTLDAPPRVMSHPVLPSGGAGQCPVDHTKFARPSAAAAAGSSSTPALAGPSVVGDVFPDATPQPNQKAKLSTAPVASQIPKGGADQSPDATWIFPSPQRFFNAMTKKGWNPQEPDMQWVVSIHNTVNEQTWRKVLEYEKLHESSCATPKLVRFKGRPSDLSPKARMLGWIGSVRAQRAE